MAWHLCDQRLAISPRSVGRILATSRLQPHRQKMWLWSQDDEFRAKRDDVLHVYYDTPPGEHIICLDEKTGIQALERRYPDGAMAAGQPVRREFEYIRHGTLTLIGAFDVRTGRAFGFTTERWNTLTIVEALDLIDACYPTGRGHIVLDNHAAHDTDDIREWFDEHPRWTRHFTPRHASWLNQIEAWFSILQRRVLARGSFASKSELQAAIYDYMLWHDQLDQPFHWTYRPKSWGRKPAPSSAGRN